MTIFRKTIILSVLFISTGCTIHTIDNTNLYYKQTLKVQSYKVLDGDTIQFTNNNNEVVKVRLTGIDAPENDQPYGVESLESLKKCLADRPIIINWSEIDKYNRLLAKVISQKIDCNLQQIQNGVAWHYKYFEKDQPLADQKSYAFAESKARQKKIGIWHTKCPVAPWDWRRKKYPVCS